MRDYIIITLMIVAGWTSDLHACSFSGDSLKAFSTSFIKETGNFYNIKTSRTDIAKWVLGGCSKSKKKFFQVSLGVNHDYIDNSTTVAALYDNFEPSACTLKPFPFKSKMTKKEEKDIFLEKLSFLNKCFDIFVTSLAGNKLKFPEEQIGCKPEYISDKKVKINGNLCYFDIINGDGFLVELKYKDSCKKRKFYEENKISTQDMVSHLGFNVVNTSDGTGEGIITVGSAVIRMSIDPDPRSMRVSDDFGRSAPLFPAIWSLPEVHFGKPRIVANGAKNKTLNLPFVADNRCKKTCVDGVCSSPCHYSSPVAAEVEVYEVENTDLFDDDFFEDEDDFKLAFKSLKKKPEYIKSFYNGGVVQANWQGQVSGNRIEVGEVLKVGKRYLLKAVFRDPKLDYHFLMKNYKSLLGKIPSFSEAEGGVLNGFSSGGADVLSRISEMMSGLETQSSDENMGVSPLRRAVLKLQSLFTYHAWPVYVDKACDSTLTMCKKPERKENLVLGIEFTLGGIQADNTYELKNLKVSRNSPIMESYSRTVKSDRLPTISCFGNEGELEGGNDK